MSKNIFRFRQQEPALSLGKSGFRLRFLKTPSGRTLTRKGKKHLLKMFLFLAFHHYLNPIIPEGYFVMCKLFLLSLDKNLLLISILHGHLKTKLMDVAALGIVWLPFNESNHSIFTIYWHK